VVSVVGAIAGRNEDVAPPRSTLSPIPFVTQDGEIRTNSLDGVAKTRLSPGGDCYYTWPTWSPHSLCFMTHRGSDQLLVDIESGYTVSNLDFAADAYRVPAWQPGADSVTFVAQDGPLGLTMFLSDPDGLARRRIRSEAVQASMLWSPSADRLAVHSADTALDYFGQPLLLGRGLTFYSPIGEPLQPQVPEPMVAFFWSPDGSRIAYVSLPDQNGVLR